MNQISGLVGGDALAGSLSPYVHQEKTRREGSQPSAGRSSPPTPTPTLSTSTWILDSSSSTVRYKRHCLSPWSLGTRGSSLDGQRQSPSPVPQDLGLARPRTPGSPLERGGDSSASTPQQVCFQRRCLLLATGKPTRPAPLRQQGGEDRLCQQKSTIPQGEPVSGDPARSRAPRTPRNALWSPGRSPCQVWAGFHLCADSIAGLGIPSSSPPSACAR